jgi:DNA-directed RNA polymerase sigma subunit (sigma70/sigma32)
VNTEGRAPAALTQALRNMHDWIYAYVSQNLHEAAALDEFTDKLMVRLQRILARNPTCCPKMAITKTVNDLVHDLNRTAIRRDTRLLRRAAFDDLVDSRQNIESTLIEQARQEEALAILSVLKDKDRDLVEQVYGIHECRLERGHVAKELGLQRNSIDQRLRRIFKSIRDALGT